MHDGQLAELNDQIQSLENDKIDLINQLDELRQQLQSREMQIRSFQVLMIKFKRPLTGFYVCCSLPL